MSSSAPADARGFAGAATALVGFGVFKLATACGLLAAAAPLAPTLLRTGSGFLVDIVVVAAIALVGRWRAALGLVLGVAAALLGAVDVTFTLAFGAPLSLAHRAWGRSAGVTLVEPGPLIAGVVAVALVVVAARALWRRPLPARVVVVAALALAGLGLLGRLVDGALDQGLARRQAGLDDNPVVALLPPAALARAAVVDVDVDGNVDVDVDAAPPPPVKRDAQKKARHVVLYLSESTAARFVDATTMPKLAALQAQSATFTDHVAESPISIKAIFAALCGLYPLPTDELETSAVPGIACASLPETLTAAGFDAALFHGGYFAFTDKLAFLGERGFERLVDGENHPDRARAWTNGWGIDDRVVVDEALRWLDARDDLTRPSLVVVIPLIPHYEYFLPPDAPSPFGTRTLIDRYRNALHFADDVYDRLVQGYRDRGLFDDTAFVFVGDHGEAFDEHPRNRLHGNFLYEENLRAPLVITAPGLAGGQVVARSSSHADLLPTILDLTGVAPPAHAPWQGQSLVSTSYTRRDVPLFTAVPTAKSGVRTARWKFIHDEQSETDELYDRAGDPREQNNVVDDHAAIVRALRARAAHYVVTQPALLASLPQRDPWLTRAAKAAGLPLVHKKVFNMARRCIPFQASTTSTTTITFTSLSPPARFVGIGIDDTSRFAKKGALHADVDVSGVDGMIHRDVLALDVDDRFEHSSVVRALPDATTITVRVAPQAKAAQGCLWLAP